MSNETDLKRYHRIRSAWLVEHGPCVKCGSWEVLEIDHIDPESKDPRLRPSSANYWRWDKEVRDKELAKCQVLCKKCHRSKTNQEIRARQSHCPQGHEYTPYNSLDNGRGARVCRECVRLRSSFNNEKIRQRKLAAKNLNTTELVVVFA